MKRSISSSHGSETNALQPTMASLTLAALGIVYGDIGTSPLYSIREAFHGSHGMAASAPNIYGILSLILWSLIIVISVKYLIFILKADNRGEGGILALMSLASPGTSGRAGRKWVILIGLFGTALLYGDGMITPAISVLSAVEGLQVATPVFGPYIIPITIAILTALFAVQKYGTALVGKIFGPVTLLWFATLALLGIYNILREPAILAAVSPVHASTFFASNGWTGFVVLGSVFLVVTGGEALYSDLGHFGARPIRLAWFFAALPALILNYFGQGALLLQQPEAISNPFFLMVPSALLYPVVIIATLATVIASQALITGVFSMSRQASQLGYIPRVTIRHTSSHHIGQIYIPRVNWMLCIACVALVLGFQSSSNLAAAYGVAVTSTMVITTILFYVVARYHWNWHPLLIGPLCGFFLVIDLAFCGANLLKIPHGGWFPLLIGLLGFTVMTTWNTGRTIIGQRLGEMVVSLEKFLLRIQVTKPQRVQGTAIYMTSNPSGTPPVLVHALEHFQVMHENLILLSVRTQNAPRVDPADRMQLTHHGSNIYSLILNCGFMEDIDVPAAINGVLLEGSRLDPYSATYILGRENLLVTPRKGMAEWRESLFVVMSQNARSAANYFNIPAERVVEIGIQVEL